MSAAVRNLCRYIILLLVMALPWLANASRAQEKAPPVWETIAIHPVRPDGGENEDDLSDGIHLHGISLTELISEAYRFNLGPFREDELSGLPGWARTQRFDIVAHVGHEDAAAFFAAYHVPRSQMIEAFSAHWPTTHMLMLQSLLTERFHLRVHSVDAERTVYAIVVDQGGPKLKPASDEHGSLMMGEGQIIGKDAPVTFIASLLGLSVGRDVIDRTGLKGAYDFELKFTPDALASKPNSDDPDIFTAIREQLGLRLETTRAPVQTLVVDHIEQPTPN